VLASPLSHSRIGIIVPRHQQTAVDRNRLKRRLRELARTRLLPALRAGAAQDLSIRAKRDAYAARTDALAADIAAIARRVALLADADSANHETPNP
jgi:ribonuclease P protein component